MLRQAPPPSTVKGHERTTGNVWCILITSLTQKVKILTELWPTQMWGLLGFRNNFAEFLGQLPSGSFLQTFFNSQKCKSQSNRANKNTDHFQQGSTVIHIKNKLIRRIPGINKNTKFCGIHIPPFPHKWGKNLDTQTYKIVENEGLCR